MKLARTHPHSPPSPNHSSFSLARKKHRILSSQASSHDSYSHPQYHTSHPPLTPLLENLPIRPLISLPLDLNRLIPSPHIIHKVPILLLARIQLRKLIALVVGRDLERRRSVLATDDKGAADDGIVGLAVDGSGTEDVFAGGFEAVEEAACGDGEANGQSGVVFYRTSARERFKEAREGRKGHYR